MKPNSKHIEWASIQEVIKAAITLETMLQDRLSEADYEMGGFDAPCASIAVLGEQALSHLAAFEAELTGWNFDMKAAPRDGTSFLVAVDYSNTGLGISMQMVYFKGSTLVYCLNGKALQDWPYAWREITLPAQPEKEGA